MPGHDPKSLLLNLSTTLLFLSPFIWFFLEVPFTTVALAYAGSLAVAVLYPPVGWMRPHPWSDKDRNKIREVRRGKRHAIDVQGLLCYRF